MYPGRLQELIDSREKQIDLNKSPEKADPSFLPIYLTGGIGDAICSIHTLEYLRKKGFQMLIYSKHAKALEYFYKELPIHEGEIPDFTWCLHLDSVAKFKITKRFKGFMLREHVTLFEQQQNWFKTYPSMEHLIAVHPVDKYVLAKKAKQLGVNVDLFPLYTLGYLDAKPVEWPKMKSESRYITIHDGFDLNNQHAVTGRATKQWSWSHWNTLVKLLHMKYPDYKIVQLGSKTARIIDGTDINLVNETTLTQAFDRISYSALHIDTDSGLAHAATALGVPSIVLFGPTPIEFYGHIQNINLSSEKTCSGGCFFLTQKWMDKCPIGYQIPQCMDDIDPFYVMDKVKQILGE